MDHFIVTIERGYGSRGKRIAKRLAKELGVEYFEDSIAQHASEMSGINLDLFLKMEKSSKSGVSKRLEFIERGEISTGSDRFKPENLYNIEAKFLRDYAEEHSMVVAGLTANRIFKSYPNCLKINIQVDQKVAVQFMMQQTGETYEEMEALIKTKDQFRTDFYKYFTGHSWRDGKYYDYMINVSHMSEEQAVNVIKFLLEEKMNRLKES